MMIFMWSYFAETDWQGTIFSTEPSKMKSNFNNPEIAGYFSAVAGTFYDVEGNNTSIRNLRLFDNSRNYRAIYDSEGEFNINFSPTGQCTLTGLNLTMIGAYEILNDAWVIIHFKKSYQQSASSLYDFFQINIKGSTIINPTPDQTLYIGGNIGFQYINDSLLKSADNIIWEL